MDNRGAKRRWTTYLYAIPLACGLGAFAPEVDGQNATSGRVIVSNTGGTSTLTSTETAAVMIRKLTERVRVALRAAPYLYARHVDVTGERDAVVLSGLVFSDWDLLDALRIAQEAAGNIRVVDNLSIVQHER